MNQSPRLIWIQDNNEKISFAPWLLRSTIFYKQTDDIKTIFRTFEQYPIDTFCASQNDYEMLDQQEQRKNNTQLQQLLSTEPIIDAMIKFR
jgi:acyl-coenzyme A synthetase/AMP-(fatty) acid ligase